MTSSSSDHDPPRVPLGTLVTWGNGYGIGTVVGCYKTPQVHDPTAVNGNVIDLGVDPVDAPDEYDGYVIMRSNDGPMSPMVGTGMFVCRSFDDKSAAYEFNHCHRDVRQAH